MIFVLSCLKVLQKYSVLLVNIIEHSNKVNNTFYLDLDSSVTKPCTYDADDWLKLCCIICNALIILTFGFNKVEHTIYGSLKSFGVC